MWFAELIQRKQGFHQGISPRLIASQPDNTRLGSLIMGQLPVVMDEVYGACVSWGKPTNRRVRTIKVRFDSIP